MLRPVWHGLVLAPALLGTIAFSAVAEPIPTTLDQISEYSKTKKETPIEPPLPSAAQNTKVFGQVTSVSQLSDVRPTDWAFQALQSLVERYGCIAGYPDRTYRGNRATTRYEFAAGLNACLNRINELIAASTADLVRKEDLATLQKLQEEFAAELAATRGIVDSLEARTATLQRQQFSTTTKLVGEAIFSVSSAFGGDRAINSDNQRIINAAPTVAAREAAINAGTGVSATNPTRRVQDNPIFGDRVRIAFDTSFSGRDRLRTQFQARNLTTFTAAVSNTNMTRLGYDGVSGTTGGTNPGSNTVELRRLEYRFPIGDLTTVFIGTGTNDGLEYNDSIPTLSPFESSGSGAISRFGRFNPIYRSATGTGIIVNQKLGREFSFGNQFTLSLGYLSPTGDAQDPGRDRGFFNGSYSALAQLVYQPTPNVGIGLTYANAYYNTGTTLTGSTGSGFANNPFGSAAVIDGAGNIPTVANQFGAEVSLRLNPRLILAGWAGVIDAKAKRQVNAINGQGTAADPAVRNGDRATILNWAVGLAFPDLLKEGSLGGIIFGMPPQVIDTDYGPNAGTGVIRRREDRDTSYHIEGFYRYLLTDNISITPGLFVILNPEGNAQNNAIFIGTIRTTFTF